MKMSRVADKTRIAGYSDLPALVELTTLARESSPLSAQLCTLGADHLEGLLKAWIGLKGATLIVAEVEGTVVGFALVQLTEPGLFSDVSFMQIEGLFVHEAYRRRGIARRLLADISRLAEESQVQHLITIVLTGSRHELRFLAGLGFVPAGARRVVDTATLNRRLAAGTRERRGGAIDELIARRRRTRDFSNLG